MNLKLRKVTSDFPDLERIFAINNEAFPEEERIPSAALLKITDRYGCRFLAICDGDETIGFIIIRVEPDLHIGYMWYFAIAADKRDKGYGSEALKLLQSTFRHDQIVLDMEQMNPNAGNYLQRLKRLRFYERNGFHRLMVGINYFGMDFELMGNNLPFRLEDFKTFLRRVQSKTWRPRLYPFGEPDKTL